MLSIRIRQEHPRISNKETYALLHVVYIHMPWRSSPNTLWIDQVCLRVRRHRIRIALLARSHTCCSPRLLVYNLKEPSPILVRSSLKRVKVDSVYTRSTPLMEVVKIGGRLDLVECLLAAGARLDVQVSG